jgi:hypothetical protein
MPLSVDELPARSLDKLLELYHNAFEPLRTLTATKQTLDDSEFRALLNYESVAVHLVNGRAGEPVAFGITVSDLKLIPWINPEFYGAQYPEHYATGRIFYVPTLLVDPAHQKGPSFVRLLRTMIPYLAERDAVVAMDCCAHNVEVERMPELIAVMCRREATLIESKEIDTQVFYSYGLAPKVT